MIQMICFNSELWSLEFVWDLMLGV